MVKIMSHCRHRPSKKQDALRRTDTKVIILLTSLAIVGMCIYPPMYSKHRYYGYNFVFQSPSWHSNIRVDLERLGVQIFAVLVVGMGLFAIGFEKKHTQSED